MRRVGEAAWLLELPGSAQVLAAYRALDERCEVAIRELVPGAESLLVLLEPGAPCDEQMLLRIEQHALGTSSHVAEHPDGGSAAQRHRVPVVYDGEDLPELASRAGIAVADLVAQHAAVEYRVAFVGFQPGFAYLDGLPRALHAPRRAAPRARVPAGSVAIGGEWTGIYPLATPGGWNLIGRTDVALFDVTHDPPALLQPGDVVVFEPR